MSVVWVWQLLPSIHILYACFIPRKSCSNKNIIQPHQVHLIQSWRSPPPMESHGGTTTHSWLLDAYVRLI